MPCEWPTEATGAIRVRSMPSAASRSMVASWVSSTPGMPSAAPIVSARCGVVVLVEPHLRLERTRERGGQLAGDGLHPAGGLLDQMRQPSGVGVLAGELAQGREPVGALASEGDGELLALGAAGRPGRGRVRGLRGQWSAWSGVAESYEECVMFPP